MENAWRRVVGLMIGISVSALMMALAICAGLMAIIAIVMLKAFNG